MWCAKDFNNISDISVTGEFECFDNDRVELVRKRFFSADNEKLFIEELEQLNCYGVFGVKKSNVDLQWQVFINNFVNIFNECFPITAVHKNKKTKSLINKCRNRKN